MAHKLVFITLTKDHINVITMATNQEPVTSIDAFTRGQTGKFQILSRIANRTSIKINFQCVDIMPRKQF